MLWQFLFDSFLKVGGGGEFEAGLNFAGRIELRVRVAVEAGLFHSFEGMVAFFIRQWESFWRMYFGCIVALGHFCKVRTYLRGVYELAICRVGMAM